MNKQLKTQFKKLSDLEFMAIASSEQTDRDGDILPVGAWSTKEFEKNPVILWGHNASIPAVARAKRVWKDLAAKELRMQIEFPEPGVSELSDTLRKLVKSGFINSLSVGFLGKDFERLNNGGRKYKSLELLEVSLVNLPSNTAALIQARDAGILSTKELKLLDGDISHLVLSNSGPDIDKDLAKIDAKELRREFRKELGIDKSIPEEFDLESIEIPADVQRKWDLHRQWEREFEKIMKK